VSGDIIISVENLGKKYSIRHERNEPYTALRDVITDKAKSFFRRNGKEIEMRREDLWALKNVSLEVKRGEVLGIIGRNGAGKSTLLKILSRITEPTEGRVLIKGRVASLLEVGTGFHPELTGRENIFLNGAVLGMTRAEIQRKFDEIVDFAEIEKFLDTPVKRYSSGMYVRLAFAVAAHLEPEILVVDEVLAVGDAEFQKKCLGKMDQVSRSEGRTVLFVSHNMGVVSSLTSRTALLEAGHVAQIGTSYQIVKSYLGSFSLGLLKNIRDVGAYRRDRNPESPAKIVSISATGNHSKSGGLATAAIGSQISVEVEVEISRAIHGAFIDIDIKDEHGTRVVFLFSLDQGYALSLRAGRHKIVAKLNDLLLSPGNYYATVGLNQSLQTKAYDVILDFPLLRIVNDGEIQHWPDRPWGLVHCRNVEWQSHCV
jgi:lipopolysaccharide transport system ATP-binding protein